MEPTNHGSNPDAVSPLHQPADGLVGNNGEAIRNGLNSVRKFLQGEMKNAGPVRFLTLYQIECEYGGPEEGGWHYDWLTPVFCVVDSDIVRKELHDVAREQFNARFMGDTFADRWHVPSHRSVSHYRATHIILEEAVPFENASHTRPRYE